MTDNKRIAFFDIIRGLAILAVVCGHCGVGGEFVYVFHIPAFFFVSGMLAHRPAENFSALKTYIAKHFVRLYWPFVALELGALALHNVFYKFGWYGAKVLSGELFSKIFGIMTLGGGEQLLGALWFLIALFEIAVIFDVCMYVCMYVCMGARKSRYYRRFL